MLAENRKNDKSVEGYNVRTSVLLSIQKIIICLANYVWGRKRTIHQRLCIREQACLITDHLLGRIDDHQAPCSMAYIASSLVSKKQENSVINGRVPFENQFHME